MDANGNVAGLDLTQTWFLLGFFFALGLVWLGAYARKWGKQMKHWEREQYLERLVTDALTNALEDAYYNGMVSKQEKKNIYKRFATVMDTKDLVPKSPRALKEEIRQRLKTEKKDVHIPGEQPVAEIVRNSLKQSTDFGKAFFRHVIP